MDEIFETATLIQTGKIRDFPVVLMGVDFWQPLVELFKRSMVPESTISPVDVDRLFLTDSPEEAMAHVMNAAGAFGLVWQPRPRWYLGESDLAAAPAPGPGSPARSSVPR